MGGQECPLKVGVFIELSRIDRKIIFVCFLRCVFEQFNPPEIFQEIESFKAIFSPVSWKQGTVKVVVEEALVIFARASDLIPDFTLAFILSESRKKASVSSNYFRNYALSVFHCVGNLVWWMFLIEAGLVSQKL
jgi:hypothetical protein